MRGRTVWKYAFTSLAVIVASAVSVHAQLANTGTTTSTTATTSTLSSGTTVLPSIAAAPKRGAAHIIEWDLPDGFDFSPGAVAVDTRGEDNNRAWFVTRYGAPEETPAGRKVYKFDFSPSLMKNNGNARWTSWTLAPEEFDQNNGGVAKIRPSHDRRFVVVRTPTSIQEIDTQACFAGSVVYPAQCAAALRRWDVAGDPELPGPFVSDLAVDDGRRIFSVGKSAQFFDGYVQMLVPTKVPYTSSTLKVEAPTGTVTRWRVGGVNQCGFVNDLNTVNASGFCNSGIDFQPDNKNQNLIYFSNQGENSIDELNITTNAVRRWLLPLDDHDQPITEPRQLKIENNGTIWVVTGSGHVVSLNPKNYSGCSSGYNRVTRHRIPIAPDGEIQNDPWGVAPDSNVVGYTDANNNKVGMLLPHDSGTCVKPTDPTVVERVDVPATVLIFSTTVVSDVVPGTPKIVVKQTTAKQDGTFVEAVISKRADYSDTSMKQPNSLVPLGITPVKWKGQGTFLYAVGYTAGSDTTTGATPIAKRIGFVRMGVPEKIKNPRDDDDADDGMDGKSHPGWHQPEAGDDDGDGVPDQQDTPNNREDMSSYDAAPAPANTATAYYPVTTTANAMTLLATATSDDPLATIAVDIYNSMGLLVATSGPTPGIATVTMLAPGAGTFNVSVRNLSGRAVNITPTVLVRQPPM